MRAIANDHPGTGACALATAMQMWLWTLQHLQKATDAEASYAVPERAPGRHFPAGRRAVLAAGLAQPDSGRDGAGSRRAAARIPRWPKGYPACSTSSPTSATCKRRTPRAKWAAVCAELVFGYNRHPAWDTEGCATCYQADELETLEGLIPGIASLARGYTDVIESDGSHPPEGRAVRALRRPRAVQPPARAPGRLPDRLAAGQGSRRRSAHQGDDSGGAGLSGMSWRGGPRRRWTWTSSASASARRRPAF